MNQLKNIERAETVKNWVFAASVTFFLIGSGFCGYAEILAPILDIHQPQDPFVVNEDYPPRPRRDREISPDAHRAAAFARWLGIGFLAFGFVAFVFPWNKVIAKGQSPSNE